MKRNTCINSIAGDITDAKAKNQIFAEQFETEWKTYKRVLGSSPLLQSNKMTLIDVRGNHGRHNESSFDNIFQAIVHVFYCCIYSDAFDVQSQDNDFFRYIYVYFIACVA